MERKKKTLVVFLPTNMSTGSRYSPDLYSFENISCGIYFASLFFAVWNRMRDFLSATTLDATCGTQVWLNDFAYTLRHGATQLIVSSQFQSNYRSNRFLCKLSRKRQTVLSCEQATYQAAIIQKSLAHGRGAYCCSGTRIQVPSTERVPVEWFR
jgi:hypothetical protein